MNLKEVFVIFCCSVLISCSLSVNNPEIDAISTAIAEVCEEYFIKKSIEFDVILYGQPTNRLNDIIDGLLDKIVNQTSIIVEHVNNTYRWHHKLERSAVVFISNEYFLNKFSNYAGLVNLFPKELTFLRFFEEVFYYFMNLETPFVGGYISDQTSVISHQLYIGVSHYADKVELITMSHFVDGSCNKAKYFSINSFIKSTRRWMKYLTAHKKFDNLHGCQLTVLEKWSPHLYPKEDNDRIIDCFRNEQENCQTLQTFLAETTRLQGFTFEIFKIAGKIANFTTTFNIQILEDESKFLTKPVAQTFVGSYSDLLRGYAPTSMIFDGSYILAATPSEFYNNYEKLWLPFDRPTWIILFYTFLVVFIAIFCLSFMAKIVRNSIFGQEISSPALNVVQVFFGIAQAKLPKASIPCFILILFIGFSQIFQTCYQSKSFELMTSDVRKPPPKSIQDLVDRNYTILSCAQGHDDVLKEVIADVYGR